MPAPAEPGISKEVVGRFWQRHPLGSYAVEAPVGSPEYFRRLEAIRDTCSQFVLDYYRFDRCRGAKVLDVGCGPGWVTRRYARAGAVVAAVDLTAEAVALTRKWLASEGLQADVRQADAEALPFESAS